MIFRILLLTLLANSALAQDIGGIQANTNEALPQSYNFQEYVFAEPNDEGTCNGGTNSTAELKGIYFSQTHRHEISHPFFFIIGERPALFQVAVEGDGASPDVMIEGSMNGSIIGSLCLKGPASLKANLDLSIPSFEDYFSVSIPKSWLKDGLSITLKIGDQEEVLSREELKIGPYTELNLVEVKMDVMDYNTENHMFEKPEDLLEELASAIPVSVVRYGEFPETLVYPELVANNDTEQLARLRSRFEMPDQGIFSDGSINSVMALAIGNLQHATEDFLSTIYFGNTLNLAPGGWGGGNTFVGMDYTDVFIHELGHAMSLPHWGEGPFGNNDANQWEYNYPYGGDAGDGSGRGEAWTFNQDLYEFIDPTCQYDARGEAGLEASDCMQRNNHCLEKRADGPGPWDGFGDFSAYAMHRYFVGDPMPMTGSVNYRGEDVPFQFRMQEGFPVVHIENGKRVYKRSDAGNHENLYWQEQLDLPGEEKLNTDVYLIYGTIHESQEQANIVYKPIKCNGTLPSQIDPTDPATFDLLKGADFSMLYQKDITIKLTYEDGSVKHVLNPYHSFSRAPYTWGFHIWRDDICNFSMVVPADKDLQKVEVYNRPFVSFGSDNDHIGNINDPNQGITAENFMDGATWKSEYVFGGEKVLGPNTIGNRVWNDLNRNGLDDFGEPGIEGVKLLLWSDSNEDGIPDSEGFGGLSVTDEDGKYSFAVGTGNYLVFVWSVDNWEVGGPLHNMLGVEGHTDPNTDINGDDNGRPGGFPGLGNLDIASGIIEITADGEPLDDGDLEDDWFDYDPSGNQTIDFGFYTEATCPVLNVEVAGIQVLCANGDLGSIELSPVEGQGPFEYIWASGETTNSLENLVAGIYDVTFTSAQSCQGNVSIEILENPPLEVLISGPDSLCLGQSTSLDFMISGGTGPYVIASSSNDLDDFEIGEYTFTITDENGCSVAIEKNISEASAASCVSSTDDLELLNIEFAPNPFSEKLVIVNPGSENLVIQFFSLTGQKLREETLSPGANTLVLSKLKSGIYISSVTNLNGEVLSVKRLVRI